MWTLTGQQYDGWLQGRVGFSVNGDHSLLIESRLTATRDGSMGLDDISIQNGYCPTNPPLAIPIDQYQTTATPMTTRM